MDALKVSQGACADWGQMVAVKEAVAWLCQSWRKNSCLIDVGWFGIDVCVCMFVWVCVFGIWGEWWLLKRVSRISPSPSVWPPYRLRALETWTLRSTPTPSPLAFSFYRHDDNKHVTRHTPEQSAIRFTVHEIWWCFYWSKDLSLIIYRLLPRRLWCQRVPCTLGRIRRERVKEIGLRGGGCVGV